MYLYIWHMLMTRWLSLHSPQSFHCPRVLRFYCCINPDCHKVEITSCWARLPESDKSIPRGVMGILSDTAPGNPLLQLEEATSQDPPTSSSPETTMKETCWDHRAMTCWHRPWKQSAFSSKPVHTAWWQWFSEVLAAGILVRCQVATNVTHRNPTNHVSYPALPEVELKTKIISLWTPLFKIYTFQINKAFVFFLNNRLLQIY